MWNHEQCRGTPLKQQARIVKALLVEGRDAHGEGPAALDWLPAKCLEPSMGA